MPKFDDEHVRINGCTVVWDGITRPDVSQDGSLKYSLKVVCPPGSPDINLFSDLADRTLQSSKFKGVLPPGGRMPIGRAQQQEFNGEYAGWHVLNCNTLRLPDVYSEAGELLDNMRYGSMIYGGQLVDVLVHCYEYDKAGNRGVATGLDAFSIISSANAPMKSFGGISTADAFAQQQQVPQQQVPQQQVPQQQVPQQQVPQQQVPQQQVPQQQVPQQQQPQQQQQQQQPQQQQQQPQQQQQQPQQQQQQPQQQQPQQQHNFLSQ